MPNDTCQFQVRDGDGAIAVLRGNQGGSNMGGETVAPHHWGLCTIRREPDPAHANLAGVTGADGDG